MLLSREPSAAGASHISSCVTFRLSPTNFRAMSGIRVVGMVRTVVVLKAPAVSPSTAKDSRVPPTSSLVWRRKSSFTKTAVTRSTLCGRLVDALKAIGGPPWGGTGRFGLQTSYAVCPAGSDSWSWRAFAAAVIFRDMAGKIRLWNGSTASQ